MSRSFTNSQKQAVALVTERNGEADHIHPYSKGGPTTVENCQILSPTANRIKSNFKFTPRKWQSRFIEAWEYRQPSTPFMLIAIPGSGKTMAALHVASKWAAAASDRRVVVAVPTVNLQEQWQAEAVKFGLELQTKEFGTNFKSGFQGAVVTYHLIANQPLIFRKLCSVNQVMVIFDEIHHCGEDAHFGIGIKEAFDLSVEKLLMSGTPWKTDGTPIPFVRYDGNGYALSDYRYDYPNALGDNVVRYLVFDHAKGCIQNDITGSTDHLDSSVSKDDASRLLKRLLDPRGDYVRRQIEDSHRQLCECRRTIPDAAAMAVCVDQKHALEIAAVINEVTGSKPSIIVSDSALENDSVGKFRRSSREWLVSVRKVSEGTDIKRLQVLCYLTNITSELFFRQVIGRVSRVRDIDDFEGYVFLPADPRLIECAQNIENAQVLAIREQSERELREIERGEMQSEFATYSTTHNGSDKIFIAGAEVPVETALRIRQIAEAAGVNQSTVHKILSQPGISFNSSTEPPTAEHVVEHVTLESRLKNLRRAINRKVGYINKQTGIPYSEIHGAFKRQENMSELELMEKLKILTRKAMNA
jgi:superfamily II DNA or RNA helicase